MAHKEQLTKERIAYDLKKESTPWHLIPVTIVIMVIGWMLAWLCSTIFADGFFAHPYVFEIILYIICFGLSIGCVIYDIMRIVSWNRIANTFDFHVVTDTLVAAEDSLDSMDSHDYNRHGYSYYLYFSGFGKLMLHSTTYYSWSKMYAMGIRGMMTYATPGDTYYIVTRDDKTILMVYNTKLFDYKE